MSRLTRFGETLSFGALCLMLVAVPLAYVPFPFLFPHPIYEYALMPKRLVFHACIVLALLGWLLSSGSGRNLRLVSSPLLLPLFGFLAVSFLAAPATTHPLDTLVELSLQLALTALFLVASALPRRRLSALLWTNAAAGLAVALIGILQYQNLAFLGLPSNGMPSATFGYRNFAAMYLVCAAPLSGFLFLSERRPVRLALSGASATLMAVYLVYTRTRGAWLGTAVALLLTGGWVLLYPSLREAFFGALRPKFDRVKKGFMLAFLALFLALAFLPARFRGTGLQRFDKKKANVVSTVASIVREGGDRGRLAMWKNTLLLIADHPLLGVGPGGWKRQYPAYDHGAMIRTDSVPRRPHNDYLWIASETGLIGLAVYLYLLVEAFLCLGRLARGPDERWRLAAPLFAVGLLALLGEACFSFPREQPQAEMLFYLLLGLAAGADAHRRWLLPRALGSVFLGLLLVLMVATTDLSRRQVGFDRYYLQTLLAEDRGDWSQARTEVDRARDYGVFRPYLLVMEGRADEKDGRYDAAAAVYRKALTYDPYDWHAHNGLGVIDKRQRRYREALSQYRQALAIYPDAMAVHNNLGALYRSMGDLDKAAAEYRIVLRKNPADPGANNNMGNIYEARGQLDSAEVAYRKALAAKPDQVQAHFNLASLYRKRKQFDRALKQFHEAARLAPREPKIYWNIGLTLEAVKDIPGAEAAFRKAVEVGPDFPQAYFNLGNLYFNLRQYGRAAREYQAFLARWKGDARFTRFAEQYLALARKLAKK